MFPLQAIVNNAAVNIRVHVSFSMLVSSGYMPSSELAVSYGASQVALVVKNPPANAGHIRDACINKLWYIHTMEY